MRAALSFGWIALYATLAAPAALAAGTDADRFCQKPGFPPILAPKDLLAENIPARILCKAKKKGTTVEIATTDSGRDMIVRTDPDDVAVFVKSVNAFVASGEDWLYCAGADSYLLIDRRKKTCSAKWTFHQPDGPGTSRTLSSTAIALVLKKKK